MGVAAPHSQNTSADTPIRHAPRDTFPARGKEKSRAYARTNPTDLALRVNSAPMTSTPAPIRHAPIALWRVAQAYMHLLYNLFGAPEDVARQHTLTRKSHALLLEWLKAGEAMMRRLLLLEAAHYPPQAPCKPRAKRTRTRKLMSFTPDEPEKWRTSFLCFESQSTRARLSPSRARREQRFLSAWPIAERYEALLRAFNDPTRLARRLAARLRAAPHRRAELMREPSYAARYVGDGYGEITAALAFADTS